MIEVTANGKDYRVDEGTTVEDFLRLLELGSGALAVECNQLVVPRAEFGTRRLAEGDRLEIVTLVGGG